MQIKQKEMVKIWIEIIKLKNRKTIKKIKDCFLEKINKIDKLFTSRPGNILKIMMKIKNEKGKSNTDFIDYKEI